MLSTYLKIREFIPLLPTYTYAYPLRSAILTVKLTHLR